MVKNGKNGKSVQTSVNIGKRYILLLSALPIFTTFTKIHYISQFDGGQFTVGKQNFSKFTIIKLS